MTKLPKHTGDDDCPACDTMHDLGLEIIQRVATAVNPEDGVKLIMGVAAALVVAGSRPEQIVTAAHLGTTMLLSNLAAMTDGKVNPTSMAQEAGHAAGLSDAAIDAARVAVQDIKTAAKAGPDIRWMSPINKVPA